MLTLVLGGAASGKSAYAESLVLKTGLPRYYLATMQVWDAECAAGGKAPENAGAKAVRNAGMPAPPRPSVPRPAGGPSCWKTSATSSPTSFTAPAGQESTPPRPFWPGWNASPPGVDNLLVV